MNERRWRRWPTRLAASLVTLFSSTGVLAIEEPPYSVLATCDGFEVRHYPEAVGAITRVSGSFDAAGNQGFRTLAGYIFGGNRQEERIAMTAPVTQSSVAGGDDDWQISFFMPSNRSVASLPNPDGTGIGLQPIPERTVAVLAFSGFWTERRFAAREETLRQLLTERSLPADGQAVWARFDPPWTPWFLRRNEIWVELPSESARIGEISCGTSPL